MLVTSNDIKNDVIVKLGITTTTAFYTDAILDDWIQQAERWATAYRKWPFSEGKQETTYTSANEEWNFEGIKADSIRILQIGGKRFEKVTFEDYQIFKEEEASGTDKIFSDFGRTVYINPNTDASGTLTTWGQFPPVAIDMTELTSTTIFSNGDEEGNTAIVEEVLSYANTREKKEDVANFHHDRATQILDGVFKNYLDEQFNYKTYKTRGGMFKRVNVVHGDIQDALIKRNQF
ncbi:MAG: hypothetical protein HN802_06840 [Candidatus Jacksonbacteria bacterium]|jgi:hypothetical protein|nr:hypothetical protein [Candidatus Jacksonbacteria bacterium]